MVLDHPVVLIPGFLHSDRLLGLFDQFQKRFLKNEITYMVAEPDPIGNIEDRTTQTMTQIRSRFRNQTVHLVGYSLGGLDARRIVTRIMEEGHWQFLVRSVTTIGTPHHGVSIMEERLAEIIRKIPRHEFDPICTAVNIFTPGEMTTFNQENPDVPGIPYIFVAGDCWDMEGTLFENFKNLVPEALTGNDIVVPVSSAAYGTGIICPRANHVTVLNERSANYIIYQLMRVEAGLQPNTRELEK